jgi:hypothetical protein
MKLYARLSQAGSIKSATSPTGGGHDTKRTRAWGVVCWSWHGLQTADVAVTQAVIDECEEFAGGGDLGDAFAAAGGDAVTVGA